jgi:hypothetical protein
MSTLFCGSKKTMRYCGVNGKNSYSPKRAIIGAG